MNQSESPSPAAFKASQFRAAADLIDTIERKKAAIADQVADIEKDERALAAFVAKMALPSSDNQPPTHKQILLPVVPLSYSLQNLSQVEAMKVILRACGPLDRSELFTRMQSADKPVKSKKQLSGLLTRYTKQHFQKASGGKWAVLDL